MANEVKKRSLKPVEPKEPEGTAHDSLFRSSRERMESLGLERVVVNTSNEQEWGVVRTRFGNDLYHYRAAIRMMPDATACFRTREGLTAHLSEFYQAGPEDKSMWALHVGRQEPPAVEIEGDVPRFDPRMGLVLPDRMTEKSAREVYGALKDVWAKGPHEQEEVPVFERDGRFRGVCYGGFEGWAEELDVQVVPSLPGTGRHRELGPRMEAKAADLERQGTEAAGVSL